MAVGLGVSARPRGCLGQLGDRGAPLGRQFGGEQFEGEPEVEPVALAELDLERGEALQQADRNSPSVRLRDGVCLSNACMDMYRVDGRCDRLLPARVHERGRG